MGGTERVTNYRPNAHLLTLHSRNYYWLNLQVRRIRQREVAQWEVAELRSEPKTQAPRAHLPELYPLKLPLRSSAGSALLCCNHGQVLSSLGLRITTLERRPLGCTICSQPWLHSRITPGAFKNLPMTQPHPG